MTYTLIRPLTSADIDQALADQRERIAVGVEAPGCAYFLCSQLGHKEVYKHADGCPVAIAERVRSGEIGGLDEGGGEGAKG